MSDWQEKETFEERLEAYLQSDDFQMDIESLKHEYERYGTAIPSIEKLNQEATDNAKVWLDKLNHCESEGHHFTETADAENGVSYLECDNCGMTQRCQW